MHSLQVLLAVGEKGKGIAKNEKKKNQSLFYLNKLLIKNKDNLPSTVLGASHILVL